MKPKQTNLQCVNSDSIGYYCIALNEIHKKCQSAECPFYKTDFQFKVAEAKAKRRCDDLGIRFKTRSQVIEEMSRLSKIQKERYEKEKKRDTFKVIQYNSQEQIYIEHENIENAAEYIKLPIEVVERIIKNKESYKGFKFVYA